MNKRPVFLLLTILLLSNCLPAQKLKTFEADNSLFQYVGRIDFTNPKLPRFWSPGVYIRAKFKGTMCGIILNDQELWGKNHNYIEVQVDNQPPVRLQTMSSSGIIGIAHDLDSNEHIITICKNTESNIGWLEFVGLQCEALLPLPPLPTRKIECYGNSITCGASSDESLIPCGKGVWQDQHNAYMSYGPTLARNVNAQWMLSAVSGIGLIHSCCNLDITMPQVFDNIEMRGDSLQWNFNLYQPDLVTVCLGQNDGLQDSVKFCTAYVSFINQLRGHYPNSQFLLLTSPMADDTLLAELKNYLAGIKNALVKSGDKKVDTYYYSKRYYKGCDTHPNVEEHQQMAAELTVFVKKKMGW